MNRKTQLSYEAVFDFIDAKILNLSAAKMFVTDYEIAMRNALKVKAPSAKFTACQFHMAQNCRKRATKIPGFIDLIKSNKSVHNIYYKLMYLALLPSKFIDQMFETLRERAKEINDPKLNKFMKYYRLQSIKREGAANISVHGSEIRTTSPAEGYNRALGDYCTKKGSFIWFCIAIRRQEFMKSTEFLQFAESGGLVGPQQKKEDKVNNSLFIFRLIFVISIFA